MERGVAESVLNFAFVSLGRGTSDLIFGESLPGSKV